MTNPLRERVQELRAQGMGTWEAQRIAQLDLIHSRLADAQTVQDLQEVIRLMLERYK